MSTEQAVRDACISQNVSDQNLEPANVVDVINYVALSLNRVGVAIAPPGAVGRGATGGHVTCLTEAVMDVAASAAQIAEAIENLAGAVRSVSEDDNELLHE